MKANRNLHCLVFAIVYNRALFAFDALFLKFEIFLEHGRKTISLEQRSAFNERRIVVWERVEIKKECRVVAVFWLRTNIFSIRSLQILKTEQQYASSS